MKTIVQLVEKQKEYILEKDKAAKQAVEANIAPVEADPSSASRAYVVGEQLFLNDVLYDVTSPISVGDAIVVDTNITAANKLSADIKSKIDDLYSKNQTLTNQINGLEENLLQNGAVNVLPFSLVDIKANNAGSSWSGNVCTHNGVTYTFDEATQSITINGTATGNRSVLLFYTGTATKLFKKGFRYKARTFNTYFNGTNDAFVQVYKTNFPYTQIDKFTGNSFVVPDDLINEKITVQIVVPQETTISNQTIKLMIASDNFTGEYVPHAKSNKELMDESKLITLSATKNDSIVDSFNIKVRKQYNAVYITGYFNITVAANRDDLLFTISGLSFLGTNDFFYALMMSSAGNISFAQIYSDGTVKVGKTEGMATGYYMVDAVLLVE